MAVRTFWVIWGYYLGKIGYFGLYLIIYTLWKNFIEYLGQNRVSYRDLSGLFGHFR